MDHGDRLDANAAAGALAALFWPDVTRATVVCGACARAGPLAALNLYGRPGALVLRCAVCDAVNVRILETPRRINLDLRGVTFLSVEVSATVSGAADDPPSGAA